MWVPDCVSVDACMHGWCTQLCFLEELLPDADLVFPVILFSWKMKHGAVDCFRCLKHSHMCLLKVLKIRCAKMVSYWRSSCIWASPRSGVENVVSRAGQALCSKIKTDKAERCDCLQWGKVWAFIVGKIAFCHLFFRVTVEPKHCLLLCAELRSVMLTSFTSRKKSGGKRTVFWVGEEYCTVSYSPAYWAVASIHFNADLKYFILPLKQQHFLSGAAGSQVLWHSSVLSFWELTLLLELWKHKAHIKT